MNTQDSEKNKSLTNALQSLKFLQRKKQSSKLQIANLETSKLLLRKLGINESEIEAINEKSLEYINLSKCKYEELIAKGDAENVDIIRYIKKHQTLPMAFLPFYKSGSRGIVNFSGGGQGGFPPPDPWGPSTSARSRAGCRARA